MISSLKGQNKWEYSLDDVYFAKAKSLVFLMNENVDHLMETNDVILILHRWNWIEQFALIRYV